MFNDIYPSLEFLRYRFNIDHNNCTFCDVDIETTVHLFFDCSFSRAFWSETFEWLKVSMKLSSQFSKNDIIFGLIMEDLHTQVVLNNIFILGKFYIHKCNFLNPLGMFVGGAVVALVFMGSVWAGENKAVIKNFKKRNPTLFVVGVLGISYLLLSLCGGVMVFLFGITLPMLLILIHASLRLRSMKNKLENKIEGVGLKKTPMGVILDLLDQQEEKINKIQDFLESKLKD
uniref:PRA1 family protein n=1 Tax=Sinocyclocheilus rhinocerous TaxID=307959 RepID=A0A673ISF1_9TELE